MKSREMYTAVMAALIMGSASGEFRRPSILDGNRRHGGQRAGNGPEALFCIAAAEAKRARKAARGAKS